LKIYWISVHLQWFDFSVIFFKCNTVNDICHVSYPFSLWNCKLSCSWRIDQPQWDDDFWGN